MAAVKRNLPSNAVISEKTRNYSEAEIRTTLCNYIYLPWGDEKTEAKALGIVYKIYTKPEGTEKEKVAVESFLGNILVKSLEKNGAENKAVRRANLLKMAAYICTVMGPETEPFEGDLAKLKSAAEILVEKQWKTPSEVVRGVKPQK